MLLVASMAFQLTMPEPAAGDVWRDWLADPEVRIITVGEAHGYSGPARLAREILETAIADRSVALLVEAWETDAIARFVESDGGPDAQHSLCEDVYAFGGRDGRGTIEWFELLDRAREHFHAGADIGVFPIIPESGIRGRWDDEGAVMIREQLAETGFDLAVGVMGNLHSRTRYPIAREASLLSFGAELGGDDVRSINVVSSEHVAPDDGGACGLSNMRVQTHDLVLCVARQRPARFCDRFESVGD